MYSFFTLWQTSDSVSGSSWRLVREVLGVYRVDLSEIVHALQQDGGLANVSEARVGGFLLEV